MGEAKSGSALFGAIDAARPRQPRSAVPPTLTLLALQAALVITWSAGFVGYRFAAEHAPTFLVTVWRFGLTALVLLPFTLPALRSASWAAVGRQALVGVFAIAACVAPLVKAIEYGVPAGLVALAANLLPLMIAGLTVAFGRRTSGMQWLGIGLGVLGVAAVVGDGLRLGSAPGWAYALPILGTLALAIATFIEGRAGGTKLPVLTALFVQSSVSVPIFAALALLEGGIAPVARPDFALSLLWLVLMPTLGGYGLYWLCLRLGSPESTSGALCLSPPVTMIWAHAAFGDPLSPTMAVGMAFSLLGLLCLNHAGQSSAANGKSSRTDRL